jgi:hypothetical protein
LVGVPESLIVQIDTWADSDEQIGFRCELGNQIPVFRRDGASCDGVIKEQVVGEREKLAPRGTCWCRPFCENVRAKKIREKRAGCRVVRHRCCAGDAECSLLHHRVGGALEDQFSGIAVAIVADDSLLPVPVEEIDLGLEWLEVSGVGAGTEELGEHPEVERETEEFLECCWRGRRERCEFW